MLCIFRLGVSQNRRILIGILPLIQEILVSRFGLRKPSLHQVRACHLQTRQRANRQIHYDTGMVNDLLKFEPGFLSIFCLQVSEPPDVCREQSCRKSKFVRKSCFKNQQRAPRILLFYTDRAARTHPAYDRFFRLLS